MKSKLIALLSLACLALAGCDTLYRDVQTFGAAVAKAQANPKVQAAEKEAAQVAFDFIQAKEGGRSINTVWGISEALNAGSFLIAQAGQPAQAVAATAQTGSDNPQATAALAAKLASITNDPALNTPALKAAAILAVAGGLDKAAETAQNAQP